MPSLRGTPSLRSATVPRPTLPAPCRLHSPRMIPSQSKISNPKEKGVYTDSPYQSAHTMCARRNLHRRDQKRRSLSRAAAQHGIEARPERPYRNARTANQLHPTISLSIAHDAREAGYVGANGHSPLHIPQPKSETTEKPAVKHTAPSTLTIPGHISLQAAKSSAPAPLERSLFGDAQEVASFADRLSERAGDRRRGEWLFAPRAYAPS